MVIRAQQIGHTDKRTRNVHTKVFVCTKLLACKTIITPLSSTPMLFKIENYFCIRKQIIFDTRRSDILNLFQLRSCC